MKTRVLFLALATVISLRAAESIPLYNASLTIGKERRFVLLSPTGQASSWLKLGDTFEGFTLKAYDNEAEVITLERDGRVFRVAIMGSSTASAAPERATQATLADAEAMLKKMRYDKMIERAIERDKKQLDLAAEKMAADREEHGEASKEEYLAFLKRLQERLQSVNDPNQLKIEMARAYSEAFSKEELDGLAAFYSTPLGEALTAKESIVHEKMSADAQARLMAALPEIQQMGRDFWAGQQAKQEAAENAVKSALPPSKH